MKNYKIKNGIFLLLLIFLFIPLNLITLIQFRSSKTNIERLQTQMLELKMQHVREIIETYQNELKSYAHLISSRQEVINSVALLKNEPPWSPDDTELLNNYPHSDYNEISDERFDTRFIQLRTLSREIFQSLNDKNEYIGNIEIMNLQAVVIMRGHRDKRGDTKSDKLILDALKGIPASGLLVSKRTGQPAIDGTAPIYQNDELVGGLKVGMYLTEKVIIEIEKRTGIEIIPFEDNRVILISSFQNENMNLKRRSEIKKIEILSFSEDTQGEAVISMNDEIYENFIKKDLIYRNLYTNAGDETYTIGIMPIKSYADKVIGAMMVLVNNKDFNQQLRKDFRAGLFRFFTILVLSLLFSLFISHQLGKPILNLKKQLKQMEEKLELEHLIPSDGPQEISDVVHVFNKLIDVISHHKHENTKLELISNLDGLTELFNKRRFHQDLITQFRENKIFSLIFFDLDNFKGINDVFGHSVGDKVLIGISKILKVFEENENISAYRYGGEEFVLILNLYQKSEAYKIAEVIRERVADSPELKSLANNLNVTISLGIAGYPEDADNEIDLITNSDYAMYYSKKKGKNRTTIYTPNVKFFFEKSDNL